MQLEDNFLSYIKNSNIKELKKLLDNKTVPLFNENKAIRLAIESGNTEIFLLLLNDPRFTFSENKNMLFLFSAEHGHYCIVKLLANDPNVNISINNHKALKKAILGNHSDIYMFLLEQITYQERLAIQNILCFAAEHGKLDIVSFLLSKNFKGSDNFCLYQSSKNNHYDITKLLINDHRFDPSYNDNIIIKNLKKIQNIEMIDLFWKNETVKNTLRYDDLNLYNKLKTKDIQDKIKNFK